MNDNKLRKLEVESQRAFNDGRDNLRMVYRYEDKFYRNNPYDEYPEEVSTEQIGRDTLIVEFVEDWNYRR
jgi:hypothetical protein